MDNEIIGYAFCVGMTVILFGIIWGLSRIISIYTDRILPDSNDDGGGQS